MVPQSSGVVIAASRRLAASVSGVHEHLLFPYVSIKTADAVDSAHHPQSHEQVYESTFRISCSDLRKVRESCSFVRAAMRAAFILTARAST